jgi:hypothetical protein
MGGSTNAAPISVKAIFKASITVNLGRKQFGLNTKTKVCTLFEKNK